MTRILLPETARQALRKAARDDLDKTISMLKGLYPHCFCCTKESMSQREFLHEPVNGFTGEPRALPMRGFRIAAKRGE